jgi:NadR type nicotinamide-nucleotide adenylyltransferase
VLKKIAITGPECTGKSTLSKQLAEHFNTVYVEEYARKYIDKLNRPYHQEDILEIAKGQKKREEKKQKQANKILFSDTELIVTKIWSEVKYQNCHPWILEQIDNQDYDLYLLCNIDLTWKEDPQREHPHLREHLFNLYKNELKDRNLNFEIISGTEKERFENALRLIKKSCKK